MGPTLAGYRCGPAVVDVETADADANRWLAEFLSPWATAASPGEGLASVRLALSEPAYADLKRAHAEAIHARVACFALDSRVVELAGRPDAESLVIADVDRGCFYRVRGSHVDIVARPGHRRNRIALMRVVREILAATMRARGQVVDLHAAAFAVEARAVLIAGAKRAGKTTLLAHALSSGRASLLANDRVFIDTCCNPDDVSGIPTFVSVRTDTLRRFPVLRRTANERPAIFHAGELASRSLRLSQDDAAPRVFTLTPAQFAERLGASHLRRAPIAAVVFPEITSAVDTWAFEPLSRADGATLLRGSLYGTHASGAPRTIFGDIAGFVPDGTEQATLAVRLASRVPILRCRLGRQAYRPGPDAWLQALDRHTVAPRSVP